MTRHYLPLAGAGALALAILGFVVSTGLADDEKIIVPKDIAEAINKMADTAAKDGDNKKAAGDFFKKNQDNLKKTMWVFKPRMDKGEGGFGLGPKAGAYEKDGIEVLIINKGNPKPRNADQKLTKEELEKNAADYIRAADVTIAMAEITHQFKPTKKLPDKDPADWTKYTDDMKKAATDVKAGVKAKDPDATKKAFIKLYSSCTNCHSTFRD
jgi:Cytochrome C'